MVVLNIFLFCFCLEIITQKELVQHLATAKRDLNILAEKELEYAKQAYNRSKEIKVLRDRVEYLEKQQALNIEKFKTKAKELKSTVSKELEEATLDAAGNSIFYPFCIIILV